MSQFAQKHVQISFCSNLKQQKCIQFEKKQSAKRRSTKNKPKKQANFRKTSNPQIFKTPVNPQKLAQIRGESRMVSNTAQDNGLSCSIPHRVKCRTEAPHNRSRSLETCKMLNIILSKLKFIKT